MFPLSYGRAAENVEGSYWEMAEGFVALVRIDRVEEKRERSFAGFVDRELCGSRAGLS